MGGKKQFTGTLILIGGIIAIVLVVIAFISVFHTDEGNSTGDRQPVAKEGPHYELADLDGGLVSFKDHRGKIVVLNVWATWCPYCVEELPDFKRLQEAYPDDVVVVAVNRGENAKIAKSFLEKEGLAGALVYLLDPKDSIYEKINGFSMPETVFIDPDGNIVSHRRGQVPYDMMVVLVEKILAGK